MGDRDALRVAGRAGGVEDVAERLAVRAAFALGQRRVGERGDLGARAVEHERGNSAVGERSASRRCVTTSVAPASSRDEADAVGRMIGVERHIGRARLQEREQRDIGVDAAIEQHGDPVARLDARAR